MVTECGCGSSGREVGIRVAVPHRGLGGSEQRRGVWRLLGRRIRRRLPPVEHDDLDLDLNSGMGGSYHCMAVWRRREEKGRVRRKCEMRVYSPCVYVPRVDRIY